MNGYATLQALHQEHIGCPECGKHRAARWKNQLVSSAYNRSTGPPVGSCLSLLEGTFVKHTWRKELQNAVPAPSLSTEPIEKVLWLRCCKMKNSLTGCCWKMWGLFGLQKYSILRIAISQNTWGGGDHAKLKYHLLYYGEKQGHRKTMLRVIIWDFDQVQKSSTKCEPFWDMFGWYGILTQHDLKSSLNLSILTSYY